MREGTVNSKQVAAVLIVADWLQKVMEHRWLGHTGPLPQLLFVLQGGPGTAKTKTLNFAKELTQRFLGCSSTAQTAFMNSAARLVDGETLHSALNIPIGAWTSSTKTLAKKKQI